MTNSEALTILREARDIYSNIDHLKIKPLRKGGRNPTLQSSILIYYAFASTQVRESAFKNWRKYAWPLYHAILIARRSIRKGEMDPIDYIKRWSALSPEAQMLTLINNCILILDPTYKYVPRMMHHKKTA